MEPNSRLNDTRLRALMRHPPKGRQVSIPDGSVPGLAVRIGSRGVPAWTLHLRVTGEAGTSERGKGLKGPKYRVTLGMYPSLGIAAARSKAQTYLAQAAGGQSPIDALERQSTAHGATVEALSKRYLDEYVRARQLRAVSKIEHALRVHIVPVLGPILADMLTRDHVRLLLARAKVRQVKEDHSRGRPQGGIEAARTALVVLRAMMNWAIDEEVITRRDNPVARMVRSLPPKQTRDRVLSIEEARLVWRAATATGYAFGTHVQLMLLTGCRGGEWARALWEWVDLEQALFVIPASAYKSKHVHVVPLVPKAVEILQAIPRGKRGGFVLSNTDGAVGLQGVPKFFNTRLMRAVIAEDGESIPAFTSHDLRRTVATRLAEALGYGGEQLIKRVLGHSDGTVTAIYNRYGYVKEMRACLDRWANELISQNTKSE